LPCVPLVKGGANVTLIDRDPGGDKASFGNAGGIAVTEVMPASAPRVLWRALGWMLDPLGPIAVRPRHAPGSSLARAFCKSGTPKEVERISRALAAINSRVYDDLVPMLRETGMAAELHRHGALSVYETEEGYQRDAPEWACKRSHGIVVEAVTGEDARRMEPALGPCSSCRPYTAVVARRRSEASSAGLECVVAQGRRCHPHGRSTSHPSRLHVIADAGDRGWRTNYCRQSSDRRRRLSASLARRLGDPVLLESERGYNTTLPSSGVAIKRELIFPNASRGDTAQLRTAHRRSCRIWRIGSPSQFQTVTNACGTGSPILARATNRGRTNWAGHRPTTPDSLPVIGYRSTNQTCCTPSATVISG